VSDDLVTLETLAGTLPDPVEFRRRALQAARDGYARAIDGQQVLTVEDTFEVQRDLARTRELAKQYSATFGAVDKELATFQRDQLERLPAGQMTDSLMIPDVEGDLRVQLDQANSYSFDEGQLLGVIAAEQCGPAADRLIELVENASTAEEQQAAVSDMLAVLVVAAVERVAQLGKLGLQVTKVRAYADQLARNGDTALSGVVRDSIIKSTETKPGAKFTRKEPAK
jgi:hypothetical protein